jgi:hypothetical protein
MRTATRYSGVLCHRRNPPRSIRTAAQACPSARRSWTSLRPPAALYAKQSRTEKYSVLNVFCRRSAVRRAERYRPGCYTAPANQPDFSIRYDSYGTPSLFSHVTVEREGGRGDSAATGEWSEEVRAAATESRSKRRARRGPGTRGKQRCR